MFARNMVMLKNGAKRRGCDAANAVVIVHSLWSHCDAGCFPSCKMKGYDGTGYSTQPWRNGIPKCVDDFLFAMLLKLLDSFCFLPFQLQA